MASCHARAVMLRRKEYETDTDYNIALAVAMHMGGDGRPATVSLATIAEHVHCHYNTADKRTKLMAAKRQLVIGKSGRYLTYAVPYDGDDGEPESDKTAAAEVVQLRQEVVELKEQVAQLTSLVKGLHTIVTSPSHDLHTTFTSFHSDYVNKVGKEEEEYYTPLPPTVPAVNGAGGVSKTQALVSYFSDKAGINPPNKKQKIAWVEGWIEPLDDILELTADDLMAAYSLVDRAIDHMRQNGLTIARPSSISSVAVMLHNKANPAAKTPNGIDTAWKEVKAQASNRGTPVFSAPWILEAVRDIWPDVKKMTAYTEKQLRATFEQKYQELNHARN